MGRAARFRDSTVGLGNKAGVEGSLSEGGGSGFTRPSPGIYLFHSLRLGSGYPGLWKGRELESTNKRGAWWPVTGTASI
jgi:hypothetical protein